MDRRAVLALGLVASLAVTALLWALGIPGFFLVLAFPFLLLPRWSRPAPRSSPRPARSGACPSCGAPGSPGHRFCPACGARLP